MPADLQKLELKIGKMYEGSDLLDEVCLEAGAKKDKVLEKIRDLKAAQEEFFHNMKNVKFMQELPRANKIIEFIDYFGLDRESCDLPEQLKNIYEQLRF